MIDKRELNILNDTIRTRVFTLQQEPAPDKRLFFEEWYPGMAKDIGNLTLRVDLIESRQKHDFRQITALETALKALQAEVAGIKKQQNEGSRS
jgi:hypothetical protein